MHPLIRCRNCDSKLLQLEDVSELSDGSYLAHRHCPECQSSDSVSVGSFAVRIWQAREERLLEQLRETANALADGAPLNAVFPAA